MGYNVKEIIIKEKQMAQKTNIKEEIGKVLLSFGKIIFGVLIFAFVLGREGAAVLTGNIPPDNYMSSSIVIPSIIAAVLLIISGLFLITKNQEEKGV